MVDILENSGPQVLNQNDVALDAAPTIPPLMDDLVDETSPKLPLAIAQKIEDSLTTDINAVLSTFNKSQGDFLLNEMNNGSLQLDKLQPIIDQKTLAGSTTQEALTEIFKDALPIRNAQIPSYADQLTTTPTRITIQSNE